MKVKKTEFLATMRKKLYQLPPQDVEKTIEYYSEMIDDYMESGYPEDAAVAKMGRVDDIALQILAGAQNPTFAAHGVQKQRKNGLLIALLIVGFPIWFSLLVTAFCLLLTAAILIATLAMVVPWSLVISFGASAIGLLIGTVVIFVGEGIGAAALVNAAGLETAHSFRNSTAYVQNWLQVLKDDKRFIVSAAGKAEKAVNLILGSAD